MLPKIHILLGGIFSIIIFIFFNISLFQAILIFLSSFLIDVDHYLYYVFIKKDISLKKSYKWFVKNREKWLALPIQERKKYKHSVLLFHGIEFWIILVYAYFLNKIFLFVILGIAVHMFLDFIEIFYIKDKFYSKFSQAYTFIRDRNKLSFY